MRLSIEAERGLLVDISKKLRNMGCIDLSTGNKKASIVPAFLFEISSRVMGA